jgi:hypothetical protein
MIEVVEVIRWGVDSIRWMLDILRDQQREERDAAFMGG